MNKDTTQIEATPAPYGAPYRELIDADKRMAEEACGELAGLLVERAARMGFNAGMMKAAVPHWQDAVLNVLNEDQSPGGVINRYTVAGMVADAVSGKRVVYIGKRPGVCLSFLEVAADPADVTGVCRANGRERIMFTSGGELIFHDARRGPLRGVVADVVVLDADASRQDRIVEQAQAIVAKSASGEVIRA